MLRERSRRRGEAERNEREGQRCCRVGETREAKMNERERGGAVDREGERGDEQRLLVGQGRRAMGGAVGPARERGDAGESGDCLGWRLRVVRMRK